MSITPEQVTAARALLRIAQSELARRSKLSIIMIRRVESPTRIEQVTADMLAAVQRTLEDGGIEFIDQGVRLRNTPDRAALLKRLQTITRRSAKRQRSIEPMTEADLYHVSPNRTAGKPA